MLEPSLTQVPYQRIFRVVGLDVRGAERRIRAETSRDGRNGRADVRHGLHHFQTHGVVTADDLDDPALGEGRVDDLDLVDRSHSPTR